MACARQSTPPPADPLFTLSVVATDMARDTLLVEIENRSSRPLHPSALDRWNFANLVKVGFRAYQAVVPVEARRLITDQQPNRDGDMMQVDWVAPLEGEREIAAFSREARTIRVPERLRGGRYSLALVVVARSGGRWLTVEEPVFGRRTASLPSSVRWLAFVVIGCLAAATAALASLLWPWLKGATT